MCKCQIYQIKGKLLMGSSGAKLESKCHIKREPLHQHQKELYLREMFTVYLFICFRLIITTYYRNRSQKIQILDNPLKPLQRTDFNTIFISCSKEFSQNHSLVFTIQNLKSKCRNSHKRKDSFVVFPNQARTRKYQKPNKHVFKLSRMMRTTKRLGSIHLAKYQNYDWIRFSNVQICIKRAVQISAFANFIHYYYLSGTKIYETGYKQVHILGPWLREFKI